MAKVRTLTELWKESLKDSELSDEEKLLKYGSNPPRVLMYGEIKRDGKRIVVQQEFEPGDKIPDGWKDSPAAFGIETQPALQRTDPSLMKVVGEIPNAAAVGAAPVIEPKKPADDKKPEK